MTKVHLILFFLNLLIFIISDNAVFSQYERRFFAEWEPANGTLIRWPLGIPGDLVKELAKDDSLYVLVETLSQKNQAISTFSAYGVNLDHCRFIFAQTYSHWTRDWGPHFVFDENGEGGIADPVFDGYPWVPGCNYDESWQVNDSKTKAQGKGYEEDDAVNSALAASYSCPLIDFPMYLTGGNVMVDGYHTAISTRQMIDENIPFGNETYFRQIAEDSLGITNYLIVDNPEINGIQHIDCFAKFLDEKTILVKQVSPGHPEYQCCEDLADYLAGQQSVYQIPYHIIRIFCGSYSGNSTAAYTNSLILNKKVLVPLFGISTDDAALQTYADAMPGYEIIGFTGSWYYYDALHCRTMGIADLELLRIKHIPLQGSQPVQDSFTIQAEIAAYSKQPVISDSVFLIYSVNFGSWDTVSMVNTISNIYVGNIPGQPDGSQIEYFIFAADQSGRTATHPIIGLPNPHVFFAGEPLFPNITYNPSSINVVASVNSSANQQLYLHNTGGMSLVYNASIAYDAPGSNFIQVYPLSGNYNTGTTQISSKTQLSLVRGYPPNEAGWMKFDLSGIPDGSIINSVEFHGYVYSNNWPYWSVTPVMNNPVTAQPSVLYADIRAEATNGYYLYREEAGTLSTGYVVHLLNGTVNEDLQAALVQDWFAIGIVDTDDNTYYINFQGWNEPNKPFLVVEYIVPPPPLNWLKLDGESSISGSLNGQNSQLINVDIHTTGLSEGNYLAYINISSNDPETPNLSIPVTLDVVDHVYADLKVFLEGPFNGTSLNTGLTQITDFPLMQPYQSTPWNYSGAEQVTTVPPNTVDWVLVEYRDAINADLATSASIIGRQAAFVLNNGSVVDLDGSSYLQPLIAVSEGLFVVIYHRNHLAVMSNVPLTLNGGIYQFDFSDGENKAYGGAIGHKALATGIWGMIAGDCNADGMVDFSDITNVWYLEAGIQDYYNADPSMDGQVNNPDKNEFIIKNINAMSQVP